MRWAISSPNIGDPAKLVDLAVTAEAAGWDGFFLWDHLHLRRAMRLEVHDPWVLLGACATRTSAGPVGPARDTGGTSTTARARQAGDDARPPQPRSRRARRRARRACRRGVRRFWRARRPESPGRDARRRTFRDRGPVAGRAVLALRAPLQGCGRGLPSATRATTASSGMGGRKVAEHPTGATRGALGWRRAAGRERRAFDTRDRGQGRRTRHGAARGLEGFDVVATLAPDFDPAEYEAAGATWAIESIWPWPDTWYDDLLARCEQGPPGVIEQNA